mmetsp:Transcript_5222/g.9581  ORF Transcript_5222/g.9581 Transcript_5222/m.9581 type:complete len:216 (+) Transcript_5222:313-960(+)|eukprot:CAMPEP_0183702470 /NCGR_PEP_ID=MMETSP0737-20130205/562_1 /TAXON_ID=385413 /ORGANISM="Thalassiosira miniscula, Strain CCMP1093" /LENGTH=215 /DNA_ID=CAMNT_0025929081 /DNA_START=189 /DNA_END=836 /DNA_ORIENTATION=-
MRTFALTVAATTMVAATAFQPPASSLPSVRSVDTQLYEYIPSGFTKASWAKFKESEAKKKAAKNLGRMGPKGFKSRSFQSFQEALERGEATHMMPVENAEKRLKAGELKLEDIPYMQRGGSWDNSDVKGAKKVRWLKSDADYADGGFKREQSVSIFGFGQGLDWTGQRDKKGPGSVDDRRQGMSVEQAKKYKAPTVSQLKNGETPKPKKKMFGLF